MKKIMSMAAMALSALFCLGITGAYAANEITLLDDTNGEFDAILRELYGWEKDINSTCCNPYVAPTSFSFNVKARGKVSVKGRFANGKKASSAAQLMISDDGAEACVVIKGSKMIPFSAVVWFGKDGAVAIESIEASFANGVKCDAAGMAGGLFAGDYALQTDNLEIALAFNGKKFTSSDGKVSYKASTGDFSGSFNEHNMNANGKSKTRKVKFSGVFIDGVGYGLTKSGAYVRIVPEAK